VNTGLRNKIVLITGASGGIGSAIARAFAGEGAKLVLHHYRGRRRVGSLQQELEQGTEALALRADLSKEAEARSLFKRATSHFGRVDTLIANAGAWEVKDIPLHQMSIRQWRKTMDRVLTPSFFAIREFLRVVEEQRKGNLVIIGSTAAIFGEAGHADYAAAKAAMAYGLTRSLKNEIVKIAPHTRDYCGGRVNCVCPGWTLVPRLAKKLSDKKAIRRVTSTMALPQLGRPEDIANAAVFVSSDVLARHITGQTLVVAGGMEGRQIWQPEEIDPENV
jgi:3-oxoacyl-[acyl-carrier protein] reductase